MRPPGGAPVLEGGWPGPPLLNGNAAQAPTHYGPIGLTLAPRGDACALVTRARSQTAL